MHRHRHAGVFKGCTCVCIIVYKPHRCAYNAKKKKTLLRRVEHRDGPFAYNFISHVELKGVRSAAIPVIKNEFI
jgi:hypothetical protein